MADTPADDGNKLQNALDDVVGDLMGENGPNAVLIVVLVAILLAIVTVVVVLIVMKKKKSKNNQVDTETKE